jgi:RNA polymerase sigma factor (sigma-70 family)
LNTEELKEINDFLEELTVLRDECKLSKSKKLQIKYEKLKQKCVQRLDFLVDNRTRKYKSFSNYDDLRQEGRLALSMALDTYYPSKGDFFWWANKYIKTRVSREANRHSTIKIPIAHAKFVQPYKMPQLPTIVDSDPDALQSMLMGQVKDMVQEAVCGLPQDQRSVIQMHFELIGRSGPSSIGKICEAMNISRVTCIKLLNEAKKSLRHQLKELA